MTDAKPYFDSKVFEALIKKYGPDFVKKLTKYATAKLRGEYVKILSVDTFTMTAAVLGIDGTRLALQTSTILYYEY